MVKLRMKKDKMILTGKQQKYQLYKMEKNDKYLTGEMSYRILYRWWRNIAIWSKYNNEIIKVYIFPSR